MDTFSYKTEEIYGHTWCINEFNLVNLFVLEGEERSIVIDTGSGIGDIRSIVESLTDKPYSVLLTHGHFDHIGGVPLFSGHKVYMNSHDRALVRSTPCSHSMKQLFISTRTPMRFPGPGHVEALLRMAEEQDTEVLELDWTEEISDGDVFDLGGRRLSAIHTPGHSDGSVCFLDEDNRVLFSGDTVNNSIILMRQPDNDPVLIRRYNRTLARLWAMSDRFDTLAIGHGDPLISKDIIKDYLDLTSGLLDGSIKGSYQEQGFRAGDVARLGKAELWYQCDR